MEMSAKNRLDNVQAALVERGVKDVKFFVGRRREVAPSKMAADVAVACEAYLAGRYKKSEPFGDSLRGPIAK